MSKATVRIAEWRKNPLLFVTDNFKIQPDAWQIDALKILGSSDPKHSRISLTACAGPGKAQPHDTLIPTPNGMRRFGDLKAGDHVLAEDGEPTKVLGVFERGVRDVYKITFSDMSSTKACGEHLWKVRATKHSKNGWSVISTEEIMKRNLVEFEIPMQGKSDFKKNYQIPMDAYAVGVWIGDGCRKTADDQLLKEIERRGFKIGARNMLGITGHLRCLGLFNEKFLPDVYKFSKIEQRIDLLRGLMDTDGCIDKDDGHCEYSTTSHRLAEDVVWLVRSLGGVSKIKIKCRDCYRVSVSTSFNPFFLKRKSDRWHCPQERYLKRYMVSIEPFGKENVRCISVADKRNCYLTNDFIVTHNSAILAWAALWFISCMGSRGEHPKGAAVAVTRDNLRDNLWPEISKWQSRSEFLRTAFEWTKERLSARDHPETWFLSARSWSKTSDEEEQGRTLSGLHSKYVLYLIDESGDIPVAVLKSAEQGLSNCEWGKIIQAGNPTSLTGMLYLAATTLRDNWNVINITGDPDDPKRSPRIGIEWAREQISKYGRKDPWVMSYILGQFPPSSINSLLSLQEVEDSMKRQIRLSEFSFAQKRLGVDTARFGMDATVIFPRQGLVAFRPVEMRDARSGEIAARVMNAKVNWGSEMEFVDGTGGYGAGTIDAMIQGGASPIEVQFNGKSIDPRFFNKRSEMYFLMAEWIRRGGKLPNIPQLRKELPAMTYTFQNGKFRMEEKDQIKKRLGFSPDFSDGLALTFALNEMPGESTLEGKMQGYTRGKLLYEYDPFSPERS